jgi:DNA methyltransferase 1-associated protein 1
VSAPTYDDEIYEKHLTDSNWTKEETDELVDLYRSCNGKWTVIADHYPGDRTMEALKSRFYTVTAALLQLTTPITSMTTADYSLYEMLTTFNPEQEISRKKLAEGHLYRRANEVDEETVLLGELQRIMLNQASLDSMREDLRRRLDYPHTTTSGYQYPTSQALTQLWQQLLAQDRLKKNPRLRPTGNASYDGGQPAATPTNAARPRESTGPSTTQPTEVSAASDDPRFGVSVHSERIPPGVSFGGDRLTKPRIAKSTLQTDKIAAILAHIGVAEVIPLSTAPVVKQFDEIMNKVQVLLELRKTGEREEQELRTRQAQVKGE